MRYRALDANRDMVWGNGAADYLVDLPATVGQAVLTRLLLLQGEWFLDITEGTPYATQILGIRTAFTRDAAVKARILGTQGVTGIASYSSAVTGRGFAVQATVDTIYGQIPVQAVL